MHKKIAKRLKSHIKYDTLAWKQLRRWKITDFWLKIVFCSTKLLDRTKIDCIPINFVFWGGFGPFGVRFGVLFWTPILTPKKGPKWPQNGVPKRTLFWVGTPGRSKNRFFFQKTDPPEFWTPFRTPNPCVFFHKMGSKWGGGTPPEGPDRAVFGSLCILSQNRPGSGKSGKFGVIWRVSIGLGRGFLVIFAIRAFFGPRFPTSTHLKDFSGVGGAQKWPWGPGPPIFWGSFWSDFWSILGSILGAYFWPLFDPFLGPKWGALENRLKIEKELQIRGPKPKITYFCIF